MGTSKSEKDTENKNAYETENFVPIEDYTGEGFTLRNANPKTGEIAEESREEVITSVKEYFLTNYKTEVEIHNIVSAVDAVSVFVESVGEPHFYSFAIVPVDVESKEVKTDEVWSEEGQVENGIEGGLYKMAFAEQFDNLDAFLEKSAQEQPITGTPQAVIQGVKGNGYTTPYYFISTFDDVFSKALDQYLENPQITSEELKRFFNKHVISSDGVSIAIEFYMADSAEEPDENVFNEIYAKLQDQGLPRGEYYLFLNDGFIDKKRAIGKKENTLDKTFEVDF